MANVDYTKLMEPFVLKGVTTTGETVSKGASGMVYKVKYCGVNYVARGINSDLLKHCGHSQLQQIRHDFLREAYVHSKCSHPNIVQFIGTYHTPSNKGFSTSVMELMDYSLYKFVKRDGPVPLHSALSILHDVSLGLWYLHSRNPPVMHCNLSPNHVFVNSKSMVAKIGGFGVALEGNRGDVRTPGTLCFMPPEALVEIAVYGLSLDVFSYGGVALYAVVGEWPILFSDVEQRQQYLDKMPGEAAVLRPLIEECLNGDPARRPTIAVVSTRIQENKRICHSETKVILVNVKMQPVCRFLTGPEESIYNWSGQT